MPSSPPPIARIRLARSWPRLLALPALLLVLGAVVTLAALFLLDGPIRYVVAATGAIPALVALTIGLRTATMRADVEDAAVRVHWLGGSRTYALVPGPVTRVRLRGERASALRSRNGVLGWQFGEAWLRGEERIEIVRLAPTRTAILMPTDRGRLAIAALSEPELLDALGRAARARRRLEELGGPDTEPPVAESGPAPAGEVEREVSAASTTLTIETPPHILTGIERAMLDERLAQERLAAEAAERELAEAEAVARAEADRIAAEEAAAETGATEAVQTTTAPEATGGLRAGRIPSVAFVLLPLAVTLGLWGAALGMGRLPPADSDTGRLTALALAFAGPATSVAAIMARAWWPRLVGVVVTSGLAAAVFIGRAVFGG